MAFSLEQATRAQRPLLAVMLSDCLRELGADGDYPYLPLYWREVGRYPYLILSDRQTAGFALVRCPGQRHRRNGGVLRQARVAAHRAGATGRPRLVHAAPRRLVAVGQPG